MPLLEQRPKQQDSIEAPSGGGPRFSVAGSRAIGAERRRAAASPTCDEAADSVEAV